MGETDQFGRARFYGLTAAVTCAHCGQPLFVERPKKDGDPLSTIVICPECQGVSRLRIYLEKEPE
jgi:uncharacterized Zn finger protein (UPF0148 family)